MKTDLKILTAPLDPFLPLLVQDYLNDAGKLQHLFHYPPQLASFEEAIAWQQQHFNNRSLLVERLFHQYETVISDRTIAHASIEKLKSKNAFTITTGHQLNIFTGPLYFLYKLISVIKLAAQLKSRYPHFEFVPVYWMLSEDHDLDEINHFYFRHEKIAWNHVAAGEPCGRLPCSELAAIAGELLGQIAGHVHLQAMLGLFRECYSVHNTLSAATREIVHRLFGKYGLIVIDGDDTILKRQLVPVLVEEIRYRSAFYLVNQSIAELQPAYHAQARPREFNFFFTGHQVRERIIIRDNKAEFLHTRQTLSLDELLRIAEKNPEFFSPNVITRPLYQELILPDVAVTGGPAEISYWLEYKKLFEHYGLRMPVLLLRDLFLLIDRITADRINKTGLETTDFLQEESRLIATWLNRFKSNELNYEEQRERLEQTYDLLAARMEATDSTLRAAVMAEKQKALNGLKHLEEKLRKALRKKEETTLNRIKKIHQLLMPFGQLQERTLNLLWLTEWFGNDFIDRLVELSDVFKPVLKIVIQPAQ
jgi:bacillithiol biosynthesis cysteine-adding enzyme BshC